MFRRLHGGVSAGVLAILSACGGGSGSDSGSGNHAPQAMALASGDVEASGTELRAALGGSVRLDGSISTDQDKDELSHEWSLVSQPEGGNAPSASSGAQLEWSPSAVGTYTYALKVSDGREKAMQTVRVAVTNQAPVASVAVAATFAAAATFAPEQPITAGASVLVDASASKDPDGDPVAVSFTLETRPSGSKAALTVTDKQARFTTDLRGLYRVKVRGVDPSGAAFETVYSFRASNRAPTPVVVATAQPVTAAAGESSLDAAVGYDVLLKGSVSDPDGGAVSGEWQLAARPDGSAATLSASTGASTLLRPDVLGDYVVTLTATDAQGARSVYRTTVRVNNRSPEASISTNAAPQSLPDVPEQLLPLGTLVTLRGDASTDADGDRLAYAWTVVARPAGSKALLSAADVASPTFKADKEGSYRFRLRVTDPAGAYSERSITLNVGSNAPVAVVEREDFMVVAGSAVKLSGGLSFDKDGDALSYSWTLDAKPSASDATIDNATAADASFTPDVEGTYVAAVRVSDGRSSSVAYVTVRAMSSLRKWVSLSFVPGQTRYSKALDKLVIAPASGVNALRVVDPLVGVVGSVALPAAVKAFNLSPDGKLAAVLYDGLASLVDLQAGKVLRTLATGGEQTDVFVTDAGILYMIGQTGGQWVDEPVTTFNGRTGAKIEQARWFSGGGTFYGTQYGVFADKLNKVFFMPMGLSPEDISYFRFDPTTLKVTSAGDSPYHGDYDMSVPLYLSGNQTLLFTTSANYFNTSNLRYAGKLAGVTSIQGFSHSDAAQEALVLQRSYDGSSYPYKPVYPGAYKRFTGELLRADGELALPKIEGAQSYGLSVFHAASGAHLLVVQTGSNKSLDENLKYYVMIR